MISGRVALFVFDEDWICPGVTVKIALFAVFGFGKDADFKSNCLNSQISWE